MIVKKHACKLFKNVLSGVQSKGNGDIITAEYHFSKSCILIHYMSMGLKSKFYVSNSYVLPSKNVK